MPSIEFDELATFLVQAKRRTYAGGDDAATVSEPQLRGRWTAAVTTAPPLKTA